MTGSSAVAYTGLDNVLRARHSSTTAAGAGAGLGAAAACPVAFCIIF